MKIIGFVTAILLSVAAHATYEWEFQVLDAVQYGCSTGVSPADLMDQVTLELPQNKTLNNLLSAAWDSAQVEQVDPDINHYNDLISLFSADLESCGGGYPLDSVRGRGRSGGF